MAAVAILHIQRAVMLPDPGAALSQRGARGWAAEPAAWFEIGVLGVRQSPST